MKIQAIIVDGKMYKQVLINTDECVCDICAFSDDCSILYTTKSIPCPDEGYKWQEVPEITDEDIKKYINEGIIVKPFIIFDVVQAIEWYKNELKKRLEE